MNISSAALLHKTQTFIWLVLALCLLTPAYAEAQSVSTPEVAQRLRTRVDLLQGSTTLERVTEALTAQTGVDIRAAPYLRDRSLFVEMRAISAAGALAALSELNDWTWKEVKENHIIITRPAIKQPHSAVEVSEAIRMALPRDVRCFLGIGVPVDELPGAQDPNMLRMFDADRASHPKRLKEARLRVSGRVYAQFKRQRDSLFDRVRAKVQSGKPIPCSTLDAGQRKALVECFVLSALNDLAGGNPTIIPETPYNAMTGNLRADLFDVENDELFLLGSNLMIGRTTIANGVRTFTGSEAPLDLPPRKNGL